MQTYGMTHTILKDLRPGSVAPAPPFLGLLVISASIFWEMRLVAFVEDFLLAVVMSLVTSVIRVKTDEVSGRNGLEIFVDGPIRVCLLYTSKVTTPVGGPRKEGEKTCWK